MIIIENIVKHVTSKITSISVDKVKVLGELNENNKETQWNTNIHQQVEITIGLCSNHSRKSKVKNGWFG